MPSFKSTDTVALSADQFDKIVELLTPAYELAKASLAQQQRHEAAALELQRQAEEVTTAKPIDLPAHEPSAAPADAPAEDAGAASAEEKTNAAAAAATDAFES